MPSSLRVAAGWVVGLLALVLARPTPRSLIAGFAVSALGEAFRLWASGHIDKTQALATGGPYAHTRNPLYLGSLILAVGVGIAAASPWAILAVLIYVAAFYPSVMVEEAVFLRARFGKEYAEWASVVPVFAPRLTPAGPRSTRFSWDRVRRNREWRTAFALPLVALVLWLRSLV